MEVHHHAGILFAHFLLVIGLAQKRQGHTVRAQGGLHHIRDIPGIVGGVEIFQAFSRVVLVLLQVVVSPVAMPQSSPQPKGKRYSISVVALE